MTRSTAAPSAPEPKFLRRGKVKEVYEVSPTELEFRFTNDISVFDKHIPSEIPYKGETLARTAAYWFDRCNRLNIPHHFLRLSGPTSMRVRRVRVVPRPRTLGPHPKDYLIPLELIVRYYLAGSMWDRVPGRQGDGPRTGLALRPDAHLRDGAARTPLRSDDQAGARRPAPDGPGSARARGARRPQLDAIRETILKVDQAMQAEIGPRGLIHVDGKKEFGIDAEGVLRVVDTFGTADEDRFWDKGAYERGRQVDFSKEFVRQHYRQSGYYDRLLRAREAKAEEPPIPPLPPLLVDEVSRLYTTVYQRLTGEPFAPRASTA